MTYSVKMATSDQRARVLVLGGTGFIGRHLVSHIVHNELASKVRVVDKVPPQMAWFNHKHTDAFKSPVVEFRHSSLINTVSVTKAFSDPDGEFDYVINLAAETKYGQSDPVYQEGIVKLSMNCANEAATRNIKMYVEFSSGQMYSSDKEDTILKPCREDGKCEPWTHLARHKLEVEHQLRSFKDLNYIIVRPAIVYGIGDKTGLTPRLIIGAIYKYIRQKMKMLWNKDLRMNTVHVEDLCRAVWHLCLNGKKGEIYNVVDTGNTTQGRISDLVSEIYNINHEFVGNVKSNVARINMSSVVEDINDKHMKPWADACERDGINNTPLNPFIDQELLYNKHLFLDGAKLLETGFEYRIPNIQINYLREILDDYINMKMFPQSLMSTEMLWSGQMDSDDDDEAAINGNGDEKTD